MAVTTVQFTKEATMDEYNRKYFNEPINFSTCFLKEVFQSNGRHVVMNGDSIALKYRTELSSYIIKKVLTESEYRKYRFNPKLFSYDMYGTTELWFMVLVANELYSATQFDTTVVYYHSPQIFRALSKIQELESQFIDYNEADVITIITSKE